MGRGAQAARYDPLILSAAKAASWPIRGADRGRGATRGINALHRPHRSKEELLQKLCAGGLATFIDAAQTALADELDPWPPLPGPAPPPW
jgi:hypothetical protein